ncbi:MAG: formylglycine-generating enzyme family protein [Calditrichaeota bacterium]|nr:formylglycine-generating enzyme family protein [Calditrichota bacterium]
MKKISGGSFVPLYGSDSSQVTVDAFYLDVFPVTNEQFQNFVKEYPKWRRSSVLRIFAEKNYLNSWNNDTTVSENMQKDTPVTNVSWFAAKEYCECQGKRLPTTDEWEYAAMASESMKNAQKDSLFNLRIISSYEKPKTYLNNIGGTYKNYWGIYDMHGLVWEWTNDFNSVLISGESRKDGDTDRSLFCAAGSVGATDLMDYAAFMRYAFRGSLKANFCIQNLGFRCAKSIKK